MPVKKKPVDSRKNGLFFNEKYIPEELLSKIFYYCDHKTLLSCQLVCKYWQCLIKDFIWRKKAEQAIDKTLPADQEISWLNYYFICDEKPFCKNLIKNHSGEMGNIDDWIVIKDKWTSERDRWTVENPASDPSLPNDSIFEDINSCFVTSWNKSSKYQYIDLIEQGFSEYILDHLQPTIKISEWYCCQRDCPALYECGIALSKANKIDLIDYYIFRRNLDDEFCDQWFQFTHEFKNYGPGLRKILFIHGGRAEQCGIGHQGAKMAGACVKLVSSKNIIDSTNPKSKYKKYLYSFLSNMHTVPPQAYALYF